VRTRQAQAHVVTIGIAAVIAAAAIHAPAAQILVEAESFADVGGWTVDAQFMDQMGSPYLLAHGLGKPVAPAETTVTFPAKGEYRVWVRTLDWVARWQTPGTPGRFTLAIDGKELATTFGTEGAAWHWQDGGRVSIDRERVTLQLQDQTGFEGRCDAILFVTEPAASRTGSVESSRQSVSRWSIRLQTGNFRRYSNGPTWNRSSSGAQPRCRSARTASVSTRRWQIQ
jgi:hypothetical protein